jgi:hypothetical protein
VPWLSRPRCRSDSSPRARRWYLRPYPAVPCDRGDDLLSLGDSRR